MTSANKFIIASEFQWCIAHLGEINNQTARAKERAMNWEAASQEEDTRNGTRRTHLLQGHGVLLPDQLLHAWALCGNKQSQLDYTPNTPMPEIKL